MVGLLHAWTSLTRSISGSTGLPSADDVAEQNDRGLPNSSKQNAKRDAAAAAAVQNNPAEPYSDDEDEPGPAQRVAHWWQARWGPNRNLDPGRSSSQCGDLAGELSAQRLDPDLEAGGRLDAADASQQPDQEASMRRVSTQDQSIMSGQEGSIVSSFSKGTSATAFASANTDAIEIAANVARTVSINRDAWEKMTEERRDFRASMKRQRRARSVCGIPTLSPETLWYRWWSLVVMLLDMSYAAFLVPIGVGFNIPGSSWNWSSVLDFTAGGVYFIDLLLGFNVAFVVTYNMKRRMVTDGKSVAKLYMLRGTFIYDFLSSIAWAGQITILILSDTHTNYTGGAADTLQILRILRILRLGRVAKRLFVSSLGTSQPSIPGLRWMNPVILYLAQVIYALGIIINFLGCLWYWVAAEEGLLNTWITEYGPFIRDYGAADGTFTIAQVQAIPKPRLYIAAIYWALTTITTVGYGDITPQTWGETLVTLGTFIIGVLVFGILIGSISSMLQRASKAARRAQLYRDKMEAVAGWLHHRKLPNHLRHQIQAYYAEVWVRQAEEGDEAIIFNELPFNLRNQVSWQLCRQVFETEPVLKDLDRNTKHVLASKMSPVKVPPGHMLFHQGGQADRVWLLQEGTVVSIYNEQEVGLDCAPSLLGSTVLLAEHHRPFILWPHGYRTTSICSLWEIHMRDLLPLLHQRPYVYRQMVQHAHIRGRDKASKHPEHWSRASYRFLHSELEDVHRQLALAAGDSQEEEEEEEGGDDDDDDRGSLVYDKQSGSLMPMKQSALRHGSGSQQGGTRDRRPSSLNLPTPERRTRDAGTSELAPATSTQSLQAQPTPTELLPAASSSLSESLVTGRKDRSSHLRQRRASAGAALDKRRPHSVDEDAKPYEEDPFLELPDEKLEPSAPAVDEQDAMPAPAKKLTKKKTTKGPKNDGAMHKVLTMLAELQAQLHEMHMLHRHQDGPSSANHTMGSIFFDGAMSAREAKEYT